MSKEDERETKLSENAENLNAAEDGDKGETQKVEGDAPSDEPKLDGAKIVGNG